MTFKGNLQDFTVARLLNLVDLARRTGTLQIDRDGEQAVLAFKEGALIHAARDGGEGGLISALRQSGAITDEQAATIEARAGGKSDKELALLLMNAGHVTQEEVVESTRSRVLDTVYSLFSWEEGTFRFESGPPQLEGVVTVRIDLEDVILEGSRRLDEVERLHEELPDLDVALRFADRPEASLRDVNLGQEGWRVVSFINPDNTIREIAAHHDLDDFQIRRIVHRLMEAGLVQIVEPEEEVEEPEEPSGPVETPPAEPAGEERLEERSVVARLLGRLRGK